MCRWKWEIETGIISVSDVMRIEYDPRSESQFKFLCVKSLEMCTLISFIGSYFIICRACTSIGRGFLILQYSSPRVDPLHVGQNKHTVNPCSQCCRYREGKHDLFGKKVSLFLLRKVSNGWTDGFMSFNYFVTWNKKHYCKLSNLGKYVHLCYPSRAVELAVSYLK